MSITARKIFFENKSRIVLSLFLAAALVFSVTRFRSGAWFNLGANKSGDSDSIKIQEPPILYILDSDAEDITQLSLTGLEIGVEKKIVFCISSVYPVDDTGSGHRISFNLELAFTNNLGAKFDLYNAEIVPGETPGAIKYESQHNNFGYFVPGTPLDHDAAEDARVTASGNDSAYTQNNYTLSQVQQKNVVAYQKYVTSSVPGTNNFSLNFENNGQTGLYDTTKCRFFILKISWDLENLNKKKIEKETDMVYILARGGSS